MEHLYTVHTRLIERTTYYFVKKILSLPEIKGVADVVVGFGMHTDFEKACSIAGIEDAECRKVLLLQLEQEKNPVTHQVADHKKSMDKGPALEISEMVYRWLSQRGTEVLN